MFTSTNSNIYFSKDVLWLVLYNSIMQNQLASDSINDFLKKMVDKISKSQY